MYVLIMGNPFDGLNLYGPFNDAEEAGDYGDTYGRNDTWWVMEVNRKEELFGSLLNA